MKKYLLVLGTFMAVSALNAQELSISDAVRLGQEGLSGSARFRAMSGAMGALGGDMSAINANPAGSVILASSRLQGTLTSFNPSNDASYFGNGTSENYNSVDYQFGAAFLFPNRNESSKWSKFAIAVNVENTNNFDNSLHISGVNPGNTIGNYFLGYANQGGVTLDWLTLQNGESISSLYGYLGEVYGFGAQQAFLGYQGYAINPVSNDPNNDAYTSNVPAGSFFQQYDMESRGYTSKLSFNGSAQYGDRWSFGLSLNSHFAYYEQWTNFYESNENNPNAGLRRARFINEIETVGDGFSFQLGTIFKATDGLRVGLAWESPTWYRLEDRLAQRFSSESEEGGTTVVDPRVVNVYDDYRLRTPGKLTGSLAYVFGKRGLVSFDYSYKDYGNMRFSPGNDYRAINDAMSDQLTAAHTFKIGTEWRAQNWSFRGGFRNESSPYKNENVMGDLTGFSGGLGYSFGNFKLDLTYDYWQRDYQKQFFVTGMTDAANIEAKAHTVSLGFAYDF